MGRGTPRQRCGPHANTRARNLQFRKAECGTVTSRLMRPFVVPQLKHEQSPEKFPVIAPPREMVVHE